MADLATLSERVDALLPQTQCGRCGFAGCRPYAKQVAAGAAEINRCPPGGEPTVAALAALLGRETLPVVAALGPARPWVVAVVDERECIGCTLCLRACPVDAIIGASKRMHAVIATECTGCELCIAPCPVDCISLEPMVGPRSTDDVGESGTEIEFDGAFRQWWLRVRAPLARARFERRERRLADERRDREHRPIAAVSGGVSRGERQAVIAAAVARSRARRARTIER